MKQCLGCKQLLPLDAFAKDASKSCGRLPRCKECKSAYDVARYAANPAPAKERSVRQRITHRRELNAMKNKWRRLHPEYYAEQAKKRAEKLKLCTPAWLSEEQKDAIKRAYSEACRLTKETGVYHTVDHILPIQGETVSGLHVPWNLRVITGAANSQKRNKIAA